MDLEHLTDLLRSLPAMQMLPAMLAKWVLLAHTPYSEAMRGTQHSPDRLIRHPIITGDVTERFPLLDSLEHGCPYRRLYLPVRISYGLRVARQSHQQRKVKS